MIFPFGAELPSSSETPRQSLRHSPTHRMSFKHYAQGSCGVPISNWEIAKQIGYGIIVSALVILSIVFMIYMFCGKCFAERTEALEKYILDLADSESEDEDDDKEPLVKDSKDKKSD